MVTIRLWHFALVRYLPRQQLISQWRELVCIAKSIDEKGTPNHILVNKVIDYPLSDLNKYCNIVLAEMLKRGYNVTNQSINKLEKYINFTIDSEEQFSRPFQKWHNDEYLQICLWNLYEKFLCGGISKVEWEMLEKIKKKFQ